MIEILIDSFLKWTDFPLPVSEEDLRVLAKILESPEHVKYGPLAKEYLENSEIKSYFDALNKE